MFKLVVYSKSHFQRRSNVVVTGMLTWFPIVANELLLAAHQRKWEVFKMRVIPRLCLYKN